MGRQILGKSEKAVAKLAKEDGMHAIGSPTGLYLLVSGGARSWMLRYSLNGRRRDMGLGSYADIGLADVRVRARELRKQIWEGTDPIDAHRQQRTTDRLQRAKRVTFAKCVEGFLIAKGDGFKNPKHRAQWRTTLETYANPLIGEMSVADVDTDDLVALLTPIWKTKTETASRVRGRIEKVLDWATTSKFRTGENPARWRGHLDSVLEKPSKIYKVAHHAALPFKQVGAFMRDLRVQKGVAAACLEFTVLTAARSGESRGAVWREIDFAARTWTIPAERMKTEKEHVVPLSDNALAVLKTMNACRLGECIFPGSKGTAPLSDMTLGAVLRRMGVDVTVHGFRSTFRDWAAEETNYPNEMAEMALAHTIGNAVEAAYRRGNLLEKRHHMMADWARYCANPTPVRRVIPMPVRSATK